MCCTKVSAWQVPRGAPLTPEAGRAVPERANELLSLPSIRELDLSVEGGKPAKRLMAKLGLEADV